MAHFSNHQQASNLRCIEQLFVDVYAPKALHTLQRSIGDMCTKVPGHICFLPLADVLLSFPLTTYFYLDQKELVWSMFLERILDENVTRAASVQFLGMNRSRADIFRRLAPQIAEAIQLLHLWQLDLNDVDEVD